MAVSSDTFNALDPEKDKVRPVDGYPDNIKDYWNKEVRTVYERMIKDSRNICRPESKEDLERLKRINSIEASMYKI